MGCSIRAKLCKIIKYFAVLQINNPVILITCIVATRKSRIHRSLVKQKAYNPPLGLTTELIDPLIEEERSQKYCGTIFDRHTSSTISVKQWLWELRLLGRIDDHQYSRSHGTGKKFRKICSSSDEIFQLLKHTLTWHIFPKCFFRFLLQTTIRLLLRIEV